MRWHRLQILVDAVADMQDEFGYACSFLSLHAFIEYISYYAIGDAKTNCLKVVGGMSDMCNGDDCGL